MSTVTVVLPARDEARYIGDALASLAGMNVIVVDDDSSDATAEMARQHGASVISGLPLPHGWTGKLWALAQGVRAASASSPDYLLLTDADVVHDAKDIERLVGKLEQDGFDLASLMVRLRTESFAEKALIPAFVYFFLMLYPPRWIASPHHRTAGAAG